MTIYFALVHAADEHARTRRIKRVDALDMLTTTARDLLRPPHSATSAT